MGQGPGQPSQLHTQTGLGLGSGSGLGSGFARSRGGGRQIISPHISPDLPRSAQISCLHVEPLEQHLPARRVLGPQTLPIREVCQS